MELNLPEYQFKIKSDTGTEYIFDDLRGKYVALTPGEWVRQNFVKFLTETLGYPKGLIGNEISLTQNGIKRRCDTLITDKYGNPLIIVEYKAPHIEITQKVFDQISRYNYVLHAKYLIVSNGIRHFCGVFDYEKRTFKFLKEIPKYEDL